MREVERLAWTSSPGRTDWRLRLSRHLAAAQCTRRARRIRVQRGIERIAMSPTDSRATWHASKPPDDFVCGIGLFNADGVCCYGTNTLLEEMNPQHLEDEAEVTFAIDALDLVEGTYKVDVAVHKQNGYQYDYHRLLYTFRVKSRVRDVGIYRPRHRWAFSPSVRFRSQ